MRATYRGSLQRDGFQCLAYSLAYLKLLCALPGIWSAILAGYLFWTRRRTLRLTLILYCYADSGKRLGAHLPPTADGVCYDL